MGDTTSFGITATKYYLPTKRVSVETIAEEMDIPDHFVKNIGIEEIWETEEETQFDMGLRTARELLQERNLRPESLDLIIYSTNLSEKLAWSASAKLASELGLRAFPSLDIYQGCNAFIAALDIAQKYFTADRSIENILYVTADKSPVRYLPGFSFYTHGAAAVLFSKDASKIKPIGTVFFGDGNYADHLYVLGGFDMPRLGGSLSQEDIEKNRAEFFLDIFRVMTKNTEKAIRQALKKASCRIEDIDLFIPNNTTKAIPFFLKEKLKLDEKKIFCENIPTGRHIGASDLIINLHDVVAQKNTAEEKKVCLISYAGGFFWGSSVMSIR